MPAIRTARRDRTRDPPLGLGTPKPTLPAPGTGTKTNKEKGKGVDAGFSTDTPSFLQRSKTARVTDDLVQRGRDAAGLLSSISGSMDLKNVQIVASSAALLFDTVQGVRNNKQACLQLLERVHQIVRALINLCGDANARVGGLAPMMARAVDGLIETLTKVHAFLQAQASHGLFARILRRFEMQEQLNQCADALQQALDVFGVQTDLITNAALGSLRRAAATRHDEVLAALRAKWGLPAAGKGEGDEDEKTLC